MCSVPESFFSPSPRTEAPDRSVIFGMIGTLATANIVIFILPATVVSVCNKITIYPLPFLTRHPPLLNFHLIPPSPDPPFLVYSSLFCPTCKNYLAVSLLKLCPISNPTLPPPRRQRASYRGLLKKLSSALLETLCPESAHTHPPILYPLVRPSVEQLQYCTNFIGTRGT